MYLRKYRKFRHFSLSHCSTYSKWSITYLSFQKFEIMRIVWKVSVFGVIVVRVFPHSDSIRKSECGKMRTRITPTRDTFYSVAPFFVRTNFIRTTRLKLLKNQEQIKKTLRLGGSKIKNQNNNGLCFLQKFSYKRMTWR